MEKLDGSWFVKLMYNDELTNWKTEEKLDRVSKGEGMECEFSWNDKNFG